DSCAALGIAGNGCGMRYHYGLFRQAIKDGRQVELMDNWLEHGFPWETRCIAESVIVQFGGQVVRHEENGRFWFTQEGGDLV
ncbi:glycogen/starch/alpha-glucan phosphorylase, partial [Vibrio cholerae O1]|nr:glycogen/starch/alpha-glucan phosphorylase [Vibrio cholerae O1]